MDKHVLRNGILNRPPTRTGTIFAALTLIILLPNFCLSTTYLKPEDNGSIELTVVNNSESIDAGKSVELAVDAPDYFTITGTSLLGPVDIQVGQSYTFVVDYEIDADAPDGSFDVILQATSTISSLAASQVTLVFAIETTPTPPPNALFVFIPIF